MFVAASDYLKVLPDSIDRWLPRSCRRSAPTASAAATPRAALRNFFEVDARFIVLSTLYALMQEKQVETERGRQGHFGSGHRCEKPNPAISYESKRHGGTRQNGRFRSPESG